MENPTPTPAPETPMTPADLFAGVLQGDELIADMAAKSAQARAAFDETMQRIVALHDSLEGVSAAARADLMFIRSLLELAKAKL